MTTPAELDLTARRPNSIAVANDEKGIRLMPSRKILTHVRSNLVAYIALCFALSGTAYAAGGQLIYSNNIVDGQVFSVDVADENLTGIDVQNLTGADIANGSLTGWDVADNSLTGAKVADNTLTGADVADNTLTGADIAENTLSVADMGCQSGKVLGFARIHGIALTHDHVDGWTSDPKYVDIVNNCAGGQVFVRGTLGGFYDIKFEGNPAALALVTINDEAATDVDNIARVQKRYEDGQGYFDVRIRDICDRGSDSLYCESQGTEPQSGNFTIMLP